MLSKLDPIPNARLNLNANNPFFGNTHLLLAGLKGIGEIFLICRAEATSINPVFDFYVKAIGDSIEFIDIQEDPYMDDSALIEFKTLPPNTMIKLRGRLLRKMDNQEIRSLVSNKRFTPA